MLHAENFKLFPHSLGRTAVTLTKRSKLNKHPHYNFLATPHV